MQILGLIPALKGGHMPSVFWGGVLASQAESVPGWESLGRDEEQFQNSCALVVMEMKCFEPFLEARNSSCG